MSQFSLSTTTTTTTTTTTNTSTTITTTTTTTHFSTLLLSDFLLFCSFILSHPLYFSYFLFFSPYLLKLFSFLSPLFITTFLLLLAFLTVSPGFIDHHLAPQALPCKMGFLLSTYHTVLSKLCSRLDGGGSAEFHLFEELEALMLVSEMLTLESGEDPVKAAETKCQVNCLPPDGIKVVEYANYQALIALVPDQKLAHKVSDKDPVEEVVQTKSEETDFLQAHEYLNFQGLVAEAKELVYNVEGEDPAEATQRRSEVNCLQALDAQENLLSRSTQQGCLEGNIEFEELTKDAQGEVDNSSSENSNKKRGEIRGEKLRVVGAEERADASSENSQEDMSRVSENVKIVGSNLETCGSMRKVKEWKRTLACKLYEERHNVDGGEGMDLLWETYEADSGKAKASNKEKKMKKRETKYSYDEDEDEEEEEEEIDGQFCCLQALKFSTGKMNLGMGRPNLVKISKALKGIGWFHHVSRSNKRGYN